MKKSIIMIFVISALIGVAMSVLILRDGTVSLPEAVAIFAYLAAARIAVMPAKRGSKAQPAEHKPAHSLRALRGLSADSLAPAHRPAA